MLDIRLFVDRFFSLSYLNMSAYSFLASKVSDEKSVDNLIEDPLCVMIFFSLADFKIVFVF